VCSYWSSAYSCLFPATVSRSEEKIPKGQMMVELDDGDSRMVEISRLRMLPQNYNRVVYDPDPISSLRKRRISTDSHDSGTSHNEKVAELCRKSAEFRKFSKAKEHNCGSGSDTKKNKVSHKKRRRDDAVRRRNDLQKFAIRSPPRAHAPVKSEESSDESMEDSEEHNNSSDDEDEGRLKKEEARLSAPAVDPSGWRGEGWRWVGEGYRRPGGKGKKKLFFKSIQRGDQLLHTNDCAVFMSTGRSDRPYIGRIEMMWESASGLKMTKVKWFYHPQEIEASRPFNLKLQGGLFQSPHTDENSVLTISHKCYVLPVKEYQRYHSLGTVASNLYYLAGSYDPAGLTLNFQPGVLKEDEEDD